MSDAACPLCDNNVFSKSWLSNIEFEGDVFNYLECSECHSLICTPMPDERHLSIMYSETYSYPDEDTAAEKFTDVLDFLKNQEKGLFIDYGCGDGILLKAVSQLGWKTLGVEFNPDAAKEVVNHDGIKVVGHLTEIKEKADVLHLGDVLEHLTSLNSQMPEILNFLKDDGLLIAHGPLEANPNLFTQTLKFFRQVRNPKRTKMAPYHVMLATTKAQRQFFNRFSLTELVFKTKEVMFPAPESISLNDVSDYRKVALFGVRKISQMISSTNLEKFGNRYFYVGRKSR